MLFRSLAAALPMGPIDREHLGFDNHIDEVIDIAVVDTQALIDKQVQEDNFTWRPIWEIGRSAYREDEHEMLTGSLVTRALHLLRKPHGQRYHVSELQDCD